MPVISYTDFSGGLDRRLPINVQEASRLWVLKNAYITTGKKIRKRPALKKLPGDFFIQSFTFKGLEAVNGRLSVFSEKHGALPTNLPDLVDDVQLTSVFYDTPSRNWVFLDIVYADIFQGYLYVAAKYLDNGSGQYAYRHHYVDAAPVTIIANSPLSASVTKAASRVFATDGEVVKYTAAGDARDWTTSSNAGFLPVALQQDTKTDCTAVGTFQDALVVFFPDNAQIWDVAVDPTANKIRKRIAGVGTEAPYTLESFASDLMFLSPFGFRSIVVQQTSDRIDDTDTGVQIDSLVIPDIAAQVDMTVVFARWIAQLGQYWCVFNLGATSKAWVYTFSRTSKIACWSEYTFPISIEGIATVGGKVYVRDALYLFELDAEEYEDDGEPVSVDVQMAFQDAKSPGVDKQFYGADFAFNGSPGVTYRYDPRDLTKETTPYTLSGDTRAGDLLPVEVVAASIAPIFRHSANEEFEIDAVQLYFEMLRS